MDPRCLSRLPQLTSQPPATDLFLTYLIEAFYPDDSHGLLSSGCGHQGSETDFYFPRDPQSKPLASQVTFPVFKTEKQKNKTN